MKQTLCLNNFQKMENFTKEFYCISLLSHLLFFEKEKKRKVFRCEVKKGKIKWMKKWTNIDSISLFSLKFKWHNLGLLFLSSFFLVFNIFFLLYFVLLYFTLHFSLRHYIKTCIYMFVCFCIHKACIQFMYIFTLRVEI